MKVKTIMLEGETGYIAIISREPKNILCEIKDQNSKFLALHHVSTNDRDDQISMAQCIQYQLDGCKGTNSMIHDYLRFITIFAD
ncbi:MAG: hypothetical protein A2Y12_10200 [Planctomycetes bacterium GWF2_42_9]|nr:MAG: hypothetical protein A2Y12_10200 [Planctomycetes bacterium GWF2_42_9]